MPESKISNELPQIAILKCRNLADIILTKSLKVTSMVMEQISSWYYVPRRSQGHFCGTPAKNAQPESNHEEASHSPSWEMLYKTTGL